MSLDYLRDVGTARQFLAGALSQGTISLVLGAGASYGMGLPSWGKLVTEVEGLSGVAVGPEEASSEELMRRMDVARRHLGDPATFLETVHSALYGSSGHLGLGTYPDELLENRMLIALGALVMSSIRGSVTDVYTLNFDDVLDWYLHLHGFRTQVVSELPALLNGDVDVRIHHFHGFLPLNEQYERSDWLVLSRQQLVDRLAEPTSSPWSATMGAQFLSKTILFVGTSMSDMDIDVILRRTATLVMGERPLGFALGTEISDDRQAELLETSVVPVSFSRHADIPQFLLEVCQLAAQMR